MPYKRFQTWVTTGRWTLPSATLLAAACWLACLLLLPGPEVEKGDDPLWTFLQDYGIPIGVFPFLGFLLYGVIGYFLIGLNNTFAIIRMRASVQTSLYFLLVAACPFLQLPGLVSLSAAAFLLALFFLFGCYQQQRPEGGLFHSFVFLGLGSFFSPLLMLLVPVFWIGAYSFRALQARSFFASLIGWSLPYWLLAGYAYPVGRMDLLWRPFRWLAELHLWELPDCAPGVAATLGYLALLFLASAFHCFATGYEDKLRTRSYLHFLILLSCCLFLCIGLLPVSGAHLLPLLQITVSILAGHLFVLTNNRSSNIFFICMLAGWLFLFGYNLWTLL